ncbi:MAG: ECF transporter S component, partial [Bacillus sp. (in: firmicutes)]
AIGMFSSISYILMLLNFPLPGFPAWLNIDFSEVPALVATIIYGPVSGIVVVLIKNILDWFMTGSETGVPIGHIANLVAAISYILPTYLIYKKISSKKGLIVGLIASTITMAIVMSLMNYYFLLPAYSVLMNWGTMSASETRAMVTSAILPFNLIKGVVVTAVFLMLFSKLQVWINKVAPAKA